MKLKHSHFCGLSSATDWRIWLKSVAPDLYDGLINAPKKGCKANQEKMVEIHQELLKRGLQAKFEAFIRQRFPYVIDEDNHTTLNVISPKKLEPTKPIVGHIETINKHKVFRSYRPDILSFPHKYIIVGDPTTLNEQIKKFTHDKVGVDTLIIEDHAYIEYFHKRYSDVVEKIPQENRDLWVYRQKAKQGKSLETLPRH
jgi:hypothetical protein